MARDWPTTVVLNLPTAQALVVEVAVTPLRRVYSAMDEGWVWAAGMSGRTGRRPRVVRGRPLDRSRATEPAIAIERWDR
jgi:hypothetical protein